VECLSERALADCESAAKAGDVKRFVKISQRQGLGLVNKIPVGSVRSQGDY
jgi:hypothetical protein